MQYRRPQAGSGDGAPSVPAFPASHGCIRITTAAMDRLFDRLPVGTPMLVYRS